MPRSIWKGTLTFGLVSVPVKLYSAATHKNVAFHQLHAKDHARIVQRRYCSAEGKEVEYGEIVKGYELAPGRYVVVEPEELAALEPASTRAIALEDFVAAEEIDAIYFDRPYFLVPDKGAARSYRLLLEAMRDTGKVAIGRIVLRSREQLVAIRPRENALMMITMNFADEIQQASSFPELDEEAEVSKRELDMARRLVDSASRPFDLADYRDTYREALLDLIDRKANGEQIILQSPAEEPGLQAPDLMSALEASLEQARARTGHDGKKSPARKRNGTPTKGKPAPGDSRAEATNAKAAAANTKRAPASAKAVPAKAKRKPAKRG